MKAAEIFKKIGKSSEQEQKKYGWNSKFSAGVDLECSCNVSEGKGELTGWLEEMSQVSVSPGRIWWVQKVMQGKQKKSQELANSSC